MSARGTAKLNDSLISYYKIQRDITSKTRQIVEHRNQKWKTGDEDERDRPGIETHDYLSRQNYRGQPLCPDTRFTPLRDTGV